MNKDGGAAFPDICENCGCTSTDHAWISRKCKNGRTYEKLIPYKKYYEIEAAMLAEDAAHKKEDK